MDGKALLRSEPASVEVDGGAGELNPGEENLGELVVTGGDGQEMLELVEETLNEVSFAVEGEVARARGFSVGFGFAGDTSIFPQRTDSRPFSRPGVSPKATWAWIASAKVCGGGLCSGWDETYISSTIS